MRRSYCLFFTTYTYLAVAFACVGVLPAQDLRELVYKAPPGGYSGLNGSVRLYEQSHAVVIGISQYKELPILPGAVRDARAVAELLSTQGFEVTLLLDQEASRSRIAEVVGDRLPTQIGKNDRVLIYFAGHAVTVGSGGGEMGYLMPVEGDNDRRVSTGISMREIQAWLSANPAKHSMFVADACYSGLALATRSTGLPETLADYLAQALEKDVRLALAAGRTDQEAHEWRGHGLFTYFFLEGLKGQADGNGDRIVTSSELYAYLEPNVSQTALANWNARQNPQLGRSGQGEFVFLVPGDPIGSGAPLPVRAENRGANTDAGLSVRSGASIPDDVDISPLTQPLERGRVVTYDAGSGLERSRFDWTAEAVIGTAGRPTIRITETGSGSVAPFPQPVQWTLEATWEAGERFVPLRVERIFTTPDGGKLMSIRQEFDRSAGTVHFTRIDQQGRPSERTFPVPTDTITGEGLALWLRHFPFESPRTVGVHLVSEEPNVYKLSFKAAGQESVKTAAGLFDAHKLRMDVDLGVFNLVKVLIPQTSFWFSVEQPHLWIKTEGLEGGYGTPKVYRELEFFERPGR